jgi:2'-5' RNA ligase
MLYRYGLPVIIPGVDPTATLSQIHIDLAALPDNFDEDTSFKWYVAQLAAAFGVDYQEIAPLMTGNLGSSQQSEIMHLKTRGKGPALIMGLFEDTINKGLIPGNVKFRFLEQDLRSETEKAEARFTRGKDRAFRLKAGELDTKAARQLAIADGDLPQWLADEIDARGETMPEVSQVQEEGSNQIDGGIESQAIKEKISYGTPSGTVIVPLYRNTDKLEQLQTSLADKWVGKAVRLTQNGMFHITLVHCPLVDAFEFKAASDKLERVINDFLPQIVTISKVSYFDTEEGKVVIGLVDESPLLTQLQKTIYDALSDYKVPISAFSNPELWTPHVTLAYVPATVEIKKHDIATLGILVDEVKFTRSDYITEQYVGVYAEKF